MSIVERYVHTIPKHHRKWDQGYIQILAIDPGTTNFAFRIERRYHSRNIVPIAFWKCAFKSNLYQAIFRKLEEYEENYLETHVFLIEKQPPRSITINRVMQHVISYFMTKLKNYPLLPEINEVSPHLKGNELGALPDENLKQWSSRAARDLLLKRQDYWSIDVMDYWLTNQHSRAERKDDDLADTITMTEAYCKIRNYPLTLSKIKILRTKESKPSRNKPKNIIIVKVLKNEHQSR